MRSWLNVRSVSVPFTQMRRCGVFGFSLCSGSTASHREITKTLRLVVDLRLLRNGSPHPPEGSLQSPQSELSMRRALAKTSGGPIPIGPSGTRASARTKVLTFTSLWSKFWTTLYFRCGSSLSCVFSGSNGSKSNLKLDGAHDVPLTLHECCWQPHVHLSCMAASKGITTPTVECHHI